MLPKIHRLTKKKEFDAVFKKGKSLKNSFLFFKTAKSNLPNSRFGFVISKKVSGKATVRNSIKRRLSHAVSSHLKATSQPLDVVITALPEIKNKEFPEIDKAVSDFFKTLNYKMPN